MALVTRHRRGPVIKRAHLGADGHIAHAGREPGSRRMPRTPPADGVNVVGLLLGQIGDADAAGQIDEGDVCVGLALKAHGKLKEDARKLGVVVVGDGVAGKGMRGYQVLGAPWP